MKTERQIIDEVLAPMREGAVETIDRALIAQADLAKKAHEDFAAKVRRIVSEAVELDLRNTFKRKG